MVMSTSEPAYEPESPLDVLSRAASLVESGASSGESQSETEPSPPENFRILDKIFFTFLTKFGGVNEHLFVICK